MPTLKLVATRDVTLGDIAMAARAVGRPLLEYDCRINLTNAPAGRLHRALLKYDDRINLTNAPPGGPHRDVCFRGATRRGFKGSFALADPLTFKMPPDTVVFDVSDSKNLAENWIVADFRFRSAPFGDFSAVELTAVLDAVAEAFGARPVVIFNRKALKAGRETPAATDTDADINDFYGFDVKAAAEEWSLPEPRWPDAHEERLFECWRCSAVLPARSFSREEDDCVNYVLGCIVLDSTSTACDSCVRDLTERPPKHPRKRKAGVLKGSRLVE